VVPSQGREELRVELKVVAVGRVGLRPVERRSATLAQHELGGCAERHLLNGRCDVQGTCDLPVPTAVASSSAPRRGGGPRLLVEQLPRASRAMRKCSRDLASYSSLRRRGRRSGGRACGGADCAERGRGGALLRPTGGAAGDCPSGLDRHLRERPAAPHLRREPRGSPEGSGLKRRFVPVSRARALPGRVRSPP
jgi:hypothetical protein